MQILPFYASLLALMFVALSLRTIRMRRRKQVAVGDGGNLELLRAMRVHSNFAEYVPISLILLYFVEQQSANPVLIHALCLCLLVGRIIHAIGVRKVRENFRYRVLGMSMTFTVIIVSAIYILLSYTW